MRKTEHLLFKDHATFLKATVQRRFHLFRKQPFPDAFLQSLVIIISKSAERGARACWSLRILHCVEIGKVQWHGWVKPSLGLCGRTSCTTQVSNFRGTESFQLPWNVCRWISYVLVKSMMDFEGWLPSPKLYLSQVNLIFHFPIIWPSFIGFFAFYFY